MLNPTARVTLDPRPTLVIEAVQTTTRELLDDVSRIEGLYNLAALAPDDLDAFIERGLSHNNPAVHALLDAQLVVPTTGALAGDSAPRELAFALNAYRAMQAAADAARPCTRDVVVIMDEILPEETRFSIDVWSRTLPYSRVDVDSPDSRDLHWIHAIVPCSIHVRALPFLRILDAAVRRQVSQPLRVMRAYLYAGQASDVYQTHADSEEAGDITAIYYPARWQDHWGGELMFYDKGEPRWAVTPRGNRLIVFHGSRPHRVAPIGIVAQATRCSLVLRYVTAPTAEDRDNLRGQDISFPDGAAELS